jgi:hypothetical protein
MLSSLLDLDLAACHHDGRGRAGISLLRDTDPVGSALVWENLLGPVEVARRILEVQATLSILNKSEYGGKPANCLTVPTALADFPVLYWEILWGNNCDFQFADSVFADFRRSLIWCSQTFSIC